MEKASRETPTARHQAVDGGQTLREALGPGAAQGDPGASGLVHPFAEAPGHPGTQVLAVAQAVLLEGDAGVVGQQVEVVPAAVGDRLDPGVARSQIALVPDAGGEGVGIADEHGGPRRGGWRPRPR